MDIYYERQSGNLCRKHSLNAFFGRNEIKTDLFNKLCDEYDRFMLIKYNIVVKSQNYDVISSNHYNIVSYILEKYGFTTIYIPINYNILKKQNIINKVENDIFIFNDSHIWIAKKVNGKWYKIDSLSGVSNININNTLDQKNVGFIIPKTLSSNDVKDNIEKIKLYLRKNRVKIDMDEIKIFLRKLHNEKKILDDLEVLLGIAVRNIEMMEKRKKINIDNISNYYNKFIKKFNNGRYLDIDLICKYVPIIIYKLCTLFYK